MNAREIHLNISIVEAASLVLKKRFIVAYDALYDIKAWLVPEHFDMLHVISNNLYWKLGDLCVVTEKALAKWDQLTRVACFVDDINAKQAELDAMVLMLNTTKMAIGDSK